MALLSLENNTIIKRVAFDGGSRFADTIYLTDVDSAGQIGAGGTILKQDRISIGGAGSDPGTPAGGDVWYRTDTGNLKFYDAIAGVAAILMHDQTPAGGDLGGFMSGPTVIGEQGISYVGARGDGQINVFDQSLNQIVQVDGAQAQCERHGSHFSAQSGGLFAWITDTGQINNGFAGNLGTGAGYAGNFLQYDMWLTSGGDWYLIICYAQDVNGSPTVDVTMNGVTLGTTFSCNAPLRTNNQFLEIVPFTVTTPGKQSFQLIDIGPGPFEIDCTFIAAFKGGP
jgi:hypothetical protein